MKITNETIKKLTNEEMNDLGSMNIGIMLYKGELKSRKSGFTRIDLVNEVHFEKLGFRFEFIKLADIDSSKWALRIFYKNTQTYEHFVAPLDGIDFFR